MAKKSTTSPDAPPKPTGVKVISRFLHNKKRYNAGDTIAKDAMTPEQAAALMTAGCLEYTY